MTTLIKAIAILGYALLAINASKADTTVVNYGPALACQPPIGGVSQCVVKATGTKVQCSMVENVKVCL